MAQFFLFALFALFISSVSAGCRSSTCSLPCDYSVVCTEHRVWWTLWIWEKSSCQGTYVDGCSASNCVYEVDAGNTIIVDPTEGNQNMPRVAPITAAPQIGVLKSLDNSNARLSYTAPADYCCYNARGLTCPTSNCPAATVQVCEAYAGGSDGYPDPACCDKTITFAVLPVQHAPTAADSTHTITQREDGARSKTLELVAQDADAPFREELTMSIVIPPNHGAITSQPMCTHCDHQSAKYDFILDYTSDPDFCGTDSFQWKVTDKDGQCATAWAHLTIECLYHPPTCATHRAVMIQDTTLDLLPEVLKDVGSDVDKGDHLTIQPPFETSVGLISDDRAFRPPEGFIGDVLVDYQITDGRFHVPCQIQVSVLDKQQPNHVATTVGTNRILLYTYAPDGCGPLSVIQDPQHGTVTKEPLSYQAAENWHGRDFVLLQTKCPSDGQRVVLLAIDVAPPPPPPAAPEPFVKAPEPQPTPVPVDCTGSLVKISGCSTSCNEGTQTSMFVVQVPAANGGKPCTHPGGALLSEPCNLGPCPAPPPPPPIDCVGRPLVVRQCSVTCGGGTMTKMFRVNRPARDGGKPCASPNGTTLSERCNTQACPPSGGQTNVIYTATSKDHRLSGVLIAMIIAFAVGAALLFLLIAAVMMYVCIKRKRKYRSSRRSESSEPAAVFPDRSPFETPPTAGPAVVVVGVVEPKDGFKEMGQDQVSAYITQQMAEGNPVIELDEGSEKATNPEEK